MKKILHLILLNFVCVYAFTQEQGRRMISYDMFTGNSDTLISVPFDGSVISDKTDFNIGWHSAIFNPLKMEIDDFDGWFNGETIKKKKVNEYYSSDGFPLRTSVLLSQEKDGVKKAKCSGSMISRKHVLTACHCVFDMHKDTLLYDALYVSPAFDNGEENPHFPGSRVRKVFKAENWIKDDNQDISILELEDPIGDETGWIGIGFTKDNEFFRDKVFYKFSYPGRHMPEIDPIPYNGGTIYFCYGYAQPLRNVLYMRGGAGIPGESGSSAILVDVGKEYTSYGALSYSVNLNHRRIDDWVFYAVKSIIEPHLTVSKKVVKDDELLIYPNPVSDKLTFIASKSEVLKITLYSLQGTKILEFNSDLPQGEIDMSYYNPGVYLLVFESDSTKFIRKILKK